jgi:phenylalanine-4-hydroxylase
MSERLSRFGWSAVAVDGFLPPRAFQAFQARGILPIAADIRTAKHLAYTPAPDIIHEAAGHAPFLADTHYGSFVRRIGAIAERAFSNARDVDAYDAIHLLSELKEDPASTAEQVARAEAAVERAVRAGGDVSESARIARLYWWTVEYGLVGTLSDYRVYGAGLLSSLGESNSCHDPSVQKRPLSAHVADVGYDITNVQPHLFVVENFAALDPVLDEVAARLAFRVGGDAALDVARASGEVATVDVDSGGGVSGIVSDVVRRGGETILVRWTGRCAVSAKESLQDAMPETTDYALPLGRLDDGDSLSELTPTTLDAHTRHGGILELRLKSGLVVRGRRRALVLDGDRACVVLLDQFRIFDGETPVFSHDDAYPLVLGSRVASARAGAPDGYFAEAPRSEKTVPPLRVFSATDLERIALYEQAASTWRHLAGPAAERELERITAILHRSFPDEWLLHWTLLEGLVRAGLLDASVPRLVGQLELLEIRFHHLEPIATGLAYIRSLVGNDDRPGHARAS